MSRVAITSFFFAVGGLCGACSPSNSFETATAQSAEPPSILAPDCGGVFDLCGYVDKATGLLVIDRKFERAFPFKEGLAAVRISSKYGYIDESGELAIDPAYQLAGTFHQGLAEVVVADKAGVIDRTGAFRLEPRFARAIPLTESTILAVPGTWTSGHFEGAEALWGPHDELGYALNLNSGAGLYHLDEGWRTAQTLRFSFFDRDKSGLIWAADKEHPAKTRGLVYGLMKTDGTWQVEPAFSHVQTLNDGFAVVGAIGPSGVERRGAVGELGEIRVPLIYDNVSYWNNGYGIAHQNGKMGLLNGDGGLVAGQFWDEVERPADNGLARVRRGSNWMSVAPDGELVPDAMDGTIVVECDAGLTIRRSGTGLAMFRPDGTPVSGIVYDLNHYDLRDCNSPLPVRLAKKWGYVTQSGLTIPDIPTFDDTYRFQGESAWAQKEGLWGKVDLSGKTVVAFQFDTRRPLSGGYSKVTRHGNELLVDAAGDPVNEVPEDPSVRASWLQCPGGSNYFSTENKWGLAGPDGEILIPAEHVAITCFKNGMSWIPISAEHGWCPIGPDGKRVQTVPCQETRYPFYQTHHFPEPLDDDAFVSSVKWFNAHLEWAAGRREEAPRMIGDGIRSSVSSTITR